MTEKQILVCIKEPGKDAYVEPLFDNTLEAFQKAVGGYIETAALAADCILVVNEEGRRTGLPYNVTICGLPLGGTIVAAGVKGGKVASVRGKHVSMVLRILNGAED